MHWIIFVQWYVPLKTGYIDEYPKMSIELLKLSMQLSIASDYEWNWLMISNHQAAYYTVLFH